MLIKTIVLIAFLIILYCLFSAVFYFSKPGRSVAFAKALTWRIVLALCLFGFLLLSFYLGWISPHGLLLIKTP